MRYRIVLDVTDGGTAFYARDLQRDTNKEAIDAAKRELRRHRNTSPNLPRKFNRWTVWQLVGAEGLSWVASGLLDP